MSAYKDAQAQNDITRNVKQYSDLDLFFGKKVVGSDVNKVTDIQAIVLFNYRSGESSEGVLNDGLYNNPNTVNMK